MNACQRQSRFRAPTGCDDSRIETKLKATSVLTRGLKVVALAVIVATAFSGASHAGELRQIGQTSISLELDDRFVNLDDGSGYVLPRTAIVQAFEFPDFALDDLGRAVEQYLAKEFPGATVAKENIVSSSREYTLFTADHQRAIPMRVWLVYGGPHPTIWLKFTQVLTAGTVPVFNREVVLRLLASAAFRDATFAAKLKAAGWSMALEAPFLSGQAVQDSGRFIAMVSDQPDFKGRLELALYVDDVASPPPLDDAAKDQVGNADWSTATVRATTFAGALGQRRSLIRRDENGETVRVIQYVSVTGTEVVMLRAEGPPDLFDDNVISVVDRIAHSVSRTKSKS